MLKDEKETRGKEILEDDLLDNVEENKDFEEVSDEEIYDEVFMEDTREIEENSKKPHISRFKKFLKYSLLFLTIFAFGASFAYFANEKFSNRVVVLTSDETNVVTAVDKARETVVSVVGYGKREKSLFSNTSDDLKAIGNGSGVIYKKDSAFAYVVTNNHVIENTEKLEVILSDGRRTDAELVGTDMWTDLAVLKIDGSYANKVIEFADSDSTLVGQTALAIGSPLGVSLSNTVTQGIISSNERQVPIDIDKDGHTDWYQTVLQTDAAINPGNSGGALINTQGQLIGINQLKISNASLSVSAEGIGFVIPANEVKIITKQLEEYSQVKRPALGVHLGTADNLSREELANLDYNSIQKGVIIRSVENDSAAARAGLEKYDVITKINDHNISSVADVRKYLFEKTKIGDTIKITYNREGVEQTVDLKLGELKNS